MADPFWKRKSLEEMSASEWESLCDGCGRCCLHKMEDTYSRRIFYTDVACRLLDGHSCSCSDYPRRTEIVPDCIVFTKENTEVLSYMPPTCAYRLVLEGEDLPWWHHLVSGDRELVHEVGISVRGRIVSEEGLSQEEIENRVRRWPQTRKIRRSGLVDLGARRKGSGEG